ncbi:conjugative transfer signal peptidase TraF [Aminobacter lissarensis]|uniref:Conjugative transfer signal peptidase TraF n=2 Tax=Aminobacter carboxidus TaxID=376165 RepID=A0A8E1WI19_9HYPH|nr:conjugative transfer signal peptidase TraF [Aminobacter lissarensis]
MEAMKQGRSISVLGTAAVGAMLTLSGWINGYRFNLTSSAPIGLWRIEAMERPVAVGDVVFICSPATSLFKDAFSRGYLRRGLCPGGLAPLLKTIVAVAGQRVRIGEDVIIDGRPLALSRVRHKDGDGRRIAPFAGGIIPSGYLFLHSPMASSYDSRYFGPIPETGLLGRASPVLTFRP